MLLSDYVRQMGLDKIAELFDVSTVTARSWRDLESIPAPAKANEIVAKTHHLVTWEKIYQPYFDKMATGEADALTIQRNALQAAWGYRTQATNQQIGATMARADAGGVSPFVSAATSLVGSATAVASRWYAGQQLRM